MIATTTEAPTPRPASTHVDRDEAIARIKKALKARSGKAWSVTGGRGTAWGWIEIHVLPKERDEHGYMPEARGRELHALLGLSPSIGVYHHGESIDPKERAWYVLRAEGVRGNADWDPKPPKVHVWGTDCNGEPEADPEMYACPDGPRCEDPECAAEAERRGSPMGPEDPQDIGHADTDPPPPPTDEEGTPESCSKCGFTAVPCLGWAGTLCPACQGPEEEQGTLDPVEDAHAAAICGVGPDPEPRLVLSYGSTVIARVPGPASGPDDEPEPPRPDHPADPDPPAPAPDFLDEIIAEGTKEDPAFPEKVDEALEARRRAFTEKRERRIERMRARADRRNRDADARWAANEKIAAIIPLGQPILVGHHSEKRHRRDLKRLDDNMRKSVEARKEAAALERRADAAEENLAISSDDPDAVEKLEQKVEELEWERKRAKEINQTIRTARASAVKRRLSARDARDLAIGALQDLGIGTDVEIAKLLTSTVYGEPQPGRDIVGIHVGVPQYRLTNIGSEIRRLKGRIFELKERAAKAAGPAEAEVIGDVRIVEEENRLRMYFPAKPPAEVRSQLKSAGFRWSPTAGAWQRFPTGNAWYAARELAKRLVRS